MNSAQLYSLTNPTYGLLYLSVMLLWLPGQRLIPDWMLVLLLSIITGIMSNQLTLIAVLLIMLLGFAVYYSESRLSSRSKNAKLIQASACVGVVIISALLATHLPVFHNLLVIDKVTLSPDATPFTMYLNFDKTMIGIFILGFSTHLIKNWQECQLMIKEMFFKSLLVIVVFIAVALILGFVRFDFKIPGFIFIWCLTNLLFTCVAEESFFRGFLQRNLTLMFRNIKNGEYLAVAIAAALFGATHYAGGATFILLTAAAGFGFGWIYMITKRIEAAIITHFLLNLVHIIFFTYPSLAAQ